VWDSADIDCRLRRPADLAAANLMSSSCATALYSRSGIVAVGKRTIHRPRPRTLDSENAGDGAVAWPTKMCSCSGALQKLHGSSRTPHHRRRHAAASVTKTCGNRDIWQPCNLRIAQVSASGTGSDLRNQVAPPGARPPPAIGSESENPDFTMTVGASASLGAPGCDACDLIRRASQ